MGKRFYNLNLSPINRHRGPGHLSSSSTGGSGWWQRRWKLSGPYLCRHLARLHQPQRPVLQPFLPSHSDPTLPSAVCPAPPAASSPQSSLQL